MCGPTITSWQYITCANLLRADQSIEPCLSRQTTADFSCNHLKPGGPFFQPLNRSRRTGTSIARHVIAESVEVHDITSYTFYCLSYSEPGCWVASSEPTMHRMTSCRVLNSCSWNKTQILHSIRILSWELTISWRLVTRSTSASDSFLLAKLLFFLLVDLRPTNGAT
jgi:hypothetical protein